MHKTQQQSLLAFRRVLNFGAARPNLTPDTADGKSLAARFTALQSVVSTIEAVNTSRLTAAQSVSGEAQNEPELRRQLVSVQLPSIVDVARSLRKTVPGISVLKTPGHNLRSATLIERSEAFATQAKVYEATLAEHGLPANAVDKLQSAIGAFKSSVDTRGTARTEVSKAKDQLKSEFQLARSIVSGLNGVMRQMLDGQPGELAAWKTAMRVGGSNSSTTSTSTTSTTSTTPIATPIPSSTSPATSSAAPQPAAPSEVQQ